MALTKGARVPERPIRVVHLVSTLNMGGLEMFVLNLARLTDRREFILHVVCLGEAGELADRFSELNIPIVALGVEHRSKARTVFSLLRHLRRLNPDILHTHNPGPHLFGTIAAHLMRSPVLINTKHGRNRTDLPRQIRMNRILSKLSACVVPVSADAASVAREIERVPESKLKVIRNGIDLELFRPPPAPRIFRKKAIHVARLNLIKDQVTLLKAAKLVSDVEPEFQLDIVGDGPSRAELEAVHRELGLDESVRLLGARQKIRELLIEADLFVLSSLSEGISLTLLEAMAAELPVVATDVGGNREVVVNERTGLLVPAQSPHQLAEAILRLLRDPQLGRAMGQAGRQRVAAEFDLRRAVKEYQSLYKLMIYSRSRSARANGFSGNLI